MKRYFNATLKLLVFVLGLMFSAHAQEFTYLNRFYYPISDTTKFQPTFYQQSLERQDSTVVGIYTLDHKLSMKKVFYFDKDKNEINFKEFHYDSLERLKSFKEFNDAMGYEFRMDFYPEGGVKYKRLSKGGEDLEIESFDEMGNPNYPYDEGAPVPFGGQLGWNKYLSMNLKFPQDAKKKRRSGTVRVFFEVDKEGNIVNPEIMNPEEVFPSLAEEVLRVVKAYPHKWTPAQKGGQAVASTMSLPISFNVP